MKRFISLTLAVIGLCFNIFVLSSCEKDKKEKYSAHSLDYFDTATTIIGYANSKEEFDAVCEDIKMQLDEYHKLYTIYNSYDGINNICALNKLNNGVHEELKVDKKIIDLLLFSKAIYEKTGGEVNIAMGSILSIWHKHRDYGLNNPEKATIPEIEELRKASEHTDINDIIINEEESTVFLADPLMTLDVGAIAKGYAVERIAEYLIAKGITDYLLNVGGNVKGISEAEGKVWRVGIENPDRESAQAYIRELEITNESVVTSGSYQRFYVVNGKSYHHIIDSETLMPCEKFASVSVICEDSGLADALSTSLFLMDYEDGKKLVEATDGVKAMWIFHNGDIKKTENFNK